jgi:ferredoxin
VTVSRDVRVVVHHGGSETTLTTASGRPLRRVLLDAGLSPYAAATERLNCGGRGLCATCGVRLLDGPDPDHWHDRLAARFGYPRLSCQVTVDRDIAVRLVEDKRVWGGREPGSDRDSGPESDPDAGSASGTDR